MFIKKQLLFQLALHMDLENAFSHSRTRRTRVKFRLTRNVLLTIMLDLGVPQLLMKMGSSQTLGFVTWKNARETHQVTVGSPYILIKWTCNLDKTKTTPD